MTQNTARRDTFDSALFGKNVAKLSLPLSLSDSPLNTYDLTLLDDQHTALTICHTGVIPENIQFLEKNGFTLVSTKTRYALPKNVVATSPITPSTFDIITEKEYTLDLADQAIAELTEQLAVISHYAKNPATRTESQTLYTLWIHNTFNGYAEKIFIAVTPLGETMGFLSLRSVHHDLFIDLLGVCTAYRNQQVATHLLSHAIVYACHQNKNLYVYTQGENIPANRFYQKNGFLLESFELVYHKSRL